MSDVAELSVVIKGKEVGLKTLLTALERSLTKTDRAAEQTSRQIDRQAQSMKRDADEAIRTAQAIARLDAAQGNASQGAAVLTAALQNNAAASQRVQLAAQTQLVNLQKLEAGAGKTASAFSQMSGVIGAAGLALSIPAAIQGVSELTLLGAQAQLVEQRFNSLATAAGTTGQALLAALRAASGGEISDLNLQLAANRAQLLGVASTAEEMGTLMAIARDRAQSLGLSATQAFDDLVTGLGRASPQILDNLAIQASAEEANTRYAASVGKSVDALSDAERRQALVNVVLEQGRASLAATGGAAETTAGKYAALGAAFDNAKAKAGGFFAGLLAPAADGAMLLLQMATNGEMLNTKLAQLVTGMNEFAVQLSRGGPAAALLTQQLNAMGLQTEVAGGQTQAAAQWILQLLGVTDELTTAQERGSSGGQQWGEATQAAGEAATQAAGAIDEETQKAILNEVQTKILSEEKRKLQEAAQAAAQGVIASGGNIEAEAARLAASSSLVDQLTAAYLRLAAATGEADRQQRAAAGRDRLAAQAGQTRDLVPGGLGVNAPGRLGVAEDDVLPTINRTLAEIAAAERKAEADRLKIKKTGGAARVSEEQKTAAKLEDLERDHQAKLADIAADGAKKRLEAENALKLAQLRGRAGFYASLASIDDNALRQDLSARYEAAAQEAGRIAQEQGADAAQAYLEASQKAIEGEAQLRQDIAAAEKEGDTNKAEYLKGLLSLQQAADAEELRQIQEQGSAVANELKARYTAEEQAYAEHLARMAETAAQHGVTLGATLPSPPATGTPAARPTAPAASASTTTATPGTGGKAATIVTDPATQGAVEVSGGRLESAINAVRDAVAAVERRVGDVEGAVRGLKTSGIKG